MTITGNRLGASGRKMSADSRFPSRVRRRGPNLAERRAALPTGQHPASLLRLADGRILLTYGIREKGNHAIGVRLSADEGRTWGAASPIVTFPHARDSGYPSTVQLSDPTLVTAWYANGIPQHERFHMGVLRWTLEP